MATDKGDYTIKFAHATDEDDSFEPTNPRDIAQGKLMLVYFVWKATNAATDPLDHILKTVDYGNSNLAAVVPAIDNA